MYCSASHECPGHWWGGIYRIAHGEAAARRGLARRRYRRSFHWTPRRSRRCAIRRVRRRRYRPRRRVALRTPNQRRDSFPSFPPPPPGGGRLPPPPPPRPPPTPPPPPPGGGGGGGGLWGVGWGGTGD